VILNGPIQWQSTPSTFAPVATVNVDFGADVQWRIGCTSSYQETLTPALAVVIDNTGNAASCKVLVSGVPIFISANTRQTIPLSQNAQYIDVIGSSGTVGVYFYANPADAPADQPNWASIIQQTVAATGFPTKFIQLGASQPLLAADIQSAYLSNTDGAIYTLAPSGGIAKDAACVLFCCTADLPNGFTVVASGGDSILLPTGVSAMLLQAKGDACILALHLSASQWIPLSMPRGWLSGFQG
jgi:hypothetical protein